ncbi:Deoxyribodipyrimidine photo-lyase [Fundidesulfovibrio magnetotacticus]|uniref:Deoxyribodipyrimidine photo-lyase n=1 Tax=Fundidesulfovibrio magnetotacticus TaxID=2730080 RepID=A0A6V8LNE7_9BACT|nr:deoxyribodipyrimidine photo-lyase [Fundidesulfovibrio magnetotacticus]GFK94143.1 Deoxyribodipyrimidine photo-lyase [Fundidesulfovibrio magnetotacticus]
MNEHRTRLLSPGTEGAGPVLYWMHRDHRARDNWGLAQAFLLARRAGCSVAAFHCLDPDYPAPNPAHVRFLLGGLEETARGLEALGVPFARLLGDPPVQAARLARAVDARAVVADFDPLRHKRRWLRDAARAMPCPLYETDSRNTVPCIAASDKRETAARTLRPKIRRLLPEFLEEFPALPVQERPPLLPPHPGLQGLEQALPRLAGARAPQGFAPGEDAAAAALERFVRHGLAGYAQARNNPSRDAQSGLSPWLHFGMLSGQRAALSAASAEAPEEDRQAFLEELVVRRELADNFCLHAQDYDQTSCYPAWARASLEKHRGDPRPALYPRDRLEAARTDDPAWNAAQTELVRTGKMHGYMRMYWCKKLLEWTPCVEEAQALAVDFNDRLSLDGRDPNGYAGIAWSLGGVHDRPWGDRPVFGVVRSMTLAGLHRKFDVEAYAVRVRNPG